MVRRLSYKGTSEASGQRQRNYTRANRSRRGNFPGGNPMAAQQSRFKESSVQTQTANAENGSPAHSAVQPRPKNHQKTNTGVCSGNRLTCPALQAFKGRQPLPRPLSCMQLEADCAQQAQSRAPITAPARCPRPLPLGTAWHSHSRHGSPTRGPWRQQGDLRKWGKREGKSSDFRLEMGEPLLPHSGWEGARFQCASTTSLQ